MGIEIGQQEKKGTRQFEREMNHVIKQLMKRGVDPTADNIFDFCRNHPADVPLISRIRTSGMEDFLRIYLLLWGKMRDRIKATKPHGQVIDPETGRPFET